VEVTLCVRNLDKPDGFSREELIAAQRLIRSEEKRQGWKVPETDGE